MEIVSKITTNTILSMDSIQEFVDRNYNTAHIRESLLSFPYAIMTQKATVRKARDAFRAADLPRQMMELEMIDDIAAEVSPITGKALYSNDKLRDSELKRRKATNEGYQDLQAQAKEAERELNAAEDELERLNNGFSAYQYVSNFVAAEMNVVAALMKVAGIPRETSDTEDNARFWPTEKAAGEPKREGTGGQPF
jgi:hypothetical protein